jgi:hypothetical protein
MEKAMEEDLALFSVQRASKLSANHVDAGLEDHYDGL